MTKITADWLKDKRTQRVFTVLQGAGFKAYCVGGCVRNALLNAPVADIDMSTDALPNKVIELAAKSSIKIIPTGIDHGTITLIVEGLPIEVTTFRRDVATDGRRAVVSFSTNIKDDARRRDFTMNALYADENGVVSDPLDGQGDLEARRVRFIGDANARIREDYLRILRFFRFHAWYGNPDEGLDAESLAACAQNVSGIDSLPAERLGAELLKLLSAPDPAPSVASMAAAGILTQVLPDAAADKLAVLVHLEQNASIDVLCRLAVLGGQDAVTRLRLSKKQAAHLEVLTDNVASMRSISELSYRQGSVIAKSVALLRAVVFEQPLSKTIDDEISLGASAVFPVKSRDLITEFQGKALGEKLKEIEQRWIASDFSLTKKALLS